MKWMQITIWNRIRVIHVRVSANINWQSERLFAVKLLVIFPEDQIRYSGIWGLIKIPGHNEA